jgi:large subunit ribosomal protein L29
MKTEELRELDAEELGGRLKGARRELYELRFKLAVGQLDNHREIRKARKEIAQILTVVHQRRLEAVEGEPFASRADDGVGRQVTEERSEDRAAEDEAAEAATPSAAVDIETEDVETTEPAASAGSSQGESRASEGAIDDTDAETGRGKRRRSRKVRNEDEG